MSTVLRWLGIVLLALVALVAAVLVAARFHDGPLAIVPGGPLESGEMATAQGADWSFVPGVQQIELQLLDPPRSRTVWIVWVDGEIYIPCGFIDLPLWKQWPHEALEDGRAVVRIAGKRYPVELERVEDPQLYAKVGARVRDKYGLGTEDLAPDPESVWYFHLRPRS